MHREKLSTISNNRLQVQTPSPIQKLRIECGHLICIRAVQRKCMCREQVKWNRPCMNAHVFVCALTEPSLDRFNFCHSVCMCASVLYMSVCMCVCVQVCCT